MESETIKAWVILLVPVLYVVLEGLKRAGVPKEWIPLVNALLAIFAGGGAALLERQDLPAAAVQIVILFLGAAGTHDRLQKLLKNKSLANQTG